MQKQLWNSVWILLFKGGIEDDSCIQWLEFTAEDTVNSLDSHFSLTQWLKGTYGSHCAVRAHENDIFIPHRVYGDDCLCGMIEKRSGERLHGLERTFGY